MDSGFQLLDSKSFSVELGSQIPIVSGILDSYSCIPDSKAQDSGFHRQKISSFRILHAKISRIPESGFPYIGRKSIYNPCKYFLSIEACSRRSESSVWREMESGVGRGVGREGG